MNGADFKLVVEEQLKRCEDVLINKAKEYASDGDRLYNFKAAAGYRSVDPKDALMGMATKHFVSISDMCQSGKTYPMDMWNEKITDAMNYMLLLKGLVVEEVKIEAEKLEAVSDRCPIHYTSDNREIIM